MIIYTRKITLFQLNFILLVILLIILLIIVYFYKNFNEKKEIINKNKETIMEVNIKNMDKSKNPTNIITIDNIYENLHDHCIVEKKEPSYIKLTIDKNTIDQIIKQHEEFEDKLGALLIKNLNIKITFSAIDLSQNIFYLTLKQNENNEKVLFVSNWVGSIKNI